MAATGHLLSIHYVFYNIHFDHLQGYHQKSSHPHIKHMLILFTLDSQSYDLPGLNFKIPKMPLNKHLLDKDSGPMYGELKQPLIHLLKSQDTKFAGMNMNSNKHEETLWHI